MENRCVFLLFDEKEELFVVVSPADNVEADEVGDDSDYFLSADGWFMDDTVEGIVMVWNDINHGFLILGEMNKRSLLFSLVFP